MADPTVNVRYMVDDVEAAVGFYTTHLDFTLLSSAAEAARGPAGNPVGLFQPH